MTDQESKDRINHLAIALGLVVGLAFGMRFALRWFPVEPFTTPEGGITPELPGLVDFLVRRRPSEAFSR